jgi:hypothetical protein
MEHITIDNNIINNIPEFFRTEILRLEYPVIYSGTKYGYINGILNRYIQLKSSPNEHVEFNARNSSSWGLAMAYLMYLNQTDARTDQMNDTYIVGTPLSVEEVHYISGRHGVVIHSGSENNFRTFGIRDFIRLIGENELQNFINWMYTYS